MAIHELESSAEPEMPQITIWQVYEDDELFHHLVINGRDTGRIDWEESSDGKTGYIDGLDAEQELDHLGIRKLAWMPIAECMRQIHPDVHSIEHLDGLITFRPTLADFGLEGQWEPYPD
jgi:hypothetical protein